MKRVICLFPAVSLMLAGSAPAAIGPTSKCLVPTPYPPPSAAAGTIYNPNMEEGFTNGAANGWIAWKDSTYTGQVHSAGTDRKFSGTASQKLTLPQPPAGWTDREAGLYQQIWVVPGATYTATAKFYLEAPPQQSYNGEDLLGWLGLDAFGENNGDGSGMRWSTNVATPNQWITATVTVQAVMPVMTLSVKGTRKFPQHGDNARVWIDEVTFSGPVPSGIRPGPEPDPIDPDSLIPAVTGPNLVANPSFEEPFTAGASAGWNKWATAGNVIWKRSQRMGLVGGGRYDCGNLLELSYMNPKSVLLMGGDPHLNPNSLGVMNDANFLANDPKFQDTIIVGRPFIDTSLSYYLADPVNRGRELADQCKYFESLVPRIDAWQALNEPGWGDSDWQNTLRFEYAFAQRCHELGLKSCSLNLSTGSPGNIWRMVDQTFSPSAKDVLAIADYLGHHVYGGPNDQLMVANQVLDDACSFALRPRKFKDMYHRRGWRMPPLMATEGSTYGGWKGEFSPDQMANDLMLMGGYMKADRWWAGYHNFAVGISCNIAWIPWDIIDQRVNDGRLITEVVGEWNANHPADAIDGLYAQMFGAGNVHPKTLAELTPAGFFTGGVNRAFTGLTPGKEYLASCWMKYEFRGQQPVQLKFHLGIDPTGQTANGAAATIDWGVDQIADKAQIHEIYTRVWRTFVAGNTTASLWLRGQHPVNNPSVMFYIDQVEVRELANQTLQTPLIEVSPQQLNVSARYGTNPPNGSFTVRNGGIETLHYQISDDAAWLSVSPTSGASTGETDTITVHYNTAGLPVGPATAEITITDPAAVNSPHTLTVNLTVTTVKPDFDGDGDVDQTDFGHFQHCLSGPGFPYASGCQDADLNGDGDVDTGDFAHFSSCISGPGAPAPQGCPG